MRFVHAADLHIDSPLVGLSRYEGAPVERIRSATRRAMENLVRLCVEERAELLVLAGDLFDGDWKDYSTGLFFSAQMARLRQEGVAVALVRGNHDAASQITKHLRLPDNVVELSSKHAETHVFEPLHVAVHGQSYARRAEMEDLARAYPDALPGLFNIGLLHTCASGRPGHDPYAPCDLETLLAKGYQYWALGHIHEREVLCEDPYVVFSGNLQGRHMRETGAKGATLVELEHGAIQSVEHRELDVVRFLVCLVSATEVEDAEGVVDQVARELEEAFATAGRALVVRVVLSGVTGADSALRQDPGRWESEIRARAAEVGDVWIERVELATAPLLSTDELARRRDAVGQVLRGVRAASSDPEQISQLQQLFSDLNGKLPVEVRRGQDGVSLDDPEFIRDALAEVERRLLVSLLDDPDG